MNKFFGNQRSVVNPDSSVAWYDRGDMLASMGNYSEALACFEKALELQPSDHIALVFRGVTLLYLERYQEALESCERALLIRPTDPEALLFRGVALHRMGRYQEAYASYEWALGRQYLPLWQTVLDTLKKFWRQFLGRQVGTTV